MLLGLSTMTSALLHLISLGLLLQLMVQTGETATCQLLSCERTEKLHSYGFNSLLQQVQIDIGECTAVYEDSQALLKNCELPKFDQVQSQQEEQEGSGEQPESCPKKCEPRSYSRIESSNRDSPLAINTIKSCYTTRHHCLKECVRKPNYLYMFPGSKYQTRIDVGKCVGQCLGNSSSTTLECVATRHRSVTVEGPNGFEAVQTIEGCSCANTLCYRADHFQSFSELVNVQTNNTTSVKKRRDRLINIGKCIGSCPGIKIRGTCYPSDDNCIFYLGERDAHCVPTQGEEHMYTDLKGNQQSVAAVKECGCGTG